MAPSICKCVAQETPCWHNEPMAIRQHQHIVTVGLAWQRLAFCYLHIHSMDLDEHVRLEVVASQDCKAHASCIQCCMKSSSDDVTAALPFTSIGFPCANACLAPALIASWKGEQVFERAASVMRKLCRWDYSSAALIAFRTSCKSGVMFVDGGMQEA